MSRHAIIENSIVINVALASADVASERGWIACPDLCEAGWTYTAGEFAPPVAPPLPTPQSVTRCQAKLALHAAGKLAAAEAALTAMAEPDRTAALIYWNDAAVFERDHTLIVAIGAALGLSDAQIDDLFREAATL